MTERFKSSLLCPEGVALFERHPPHFSTAVYNPGLSLHQDGILNGSQNVALSGRVYVRADAAYGAIKPGDLLTTSMTPGHAMKVSNSGRAQGAILGKAMSGLKVGKGMVLVLVTLQ